MPKSRIILLCADESKAGLKAADWTLENFYREGDIIHLFHIVPISKYVKISADMSEMVQDDAGTRKQIEDDARAFLSKDYFPRFEVNKVPYEVNIVRFSTSVDNYGAMICKKAKELHASMVVMVKHNKGLVKELINGSATNYCAHHCKSPLTIIQGDDE